MQLYEHLEARLVEVRLVALLNEFIAHESVLEDLGDVEDEVAALDWCDTLIENVFQEQSVGLEHFEALPFLGPQDVSRALLVFKVSCLGRNADDSLFEELVDLGHAYGVPLAGLGVFARRDDP